MPKNNPAFEPTMQWPKWWESLSLDEGNVRRFLVTLKRDRPRLSEVSSFVGQAVLPRVQKFVSRIPWPQVEDADLYSMMLGHIALGKAIDGVLKPLPETSQAVKELAFLYWLCYEAANPTVSGLDAYFREPVDRLKVLFAETIYFALAGPLADEEATKRLRKHPPGFTSVKYLILYRFYPQDHPHLADALDSLWKMAYKHLGVEGPSLHGRYGRDALRDLLKSQTHLTLSERYPQPQTPYPAVDLFLRAPNMDIAPRAITDDLREHLKKDEDYQGPEHRCLLCQGHYYGERKGSKCQKCGKRIKCLSCGQHPRPGGHDNLCSRCGGTLSIQTTPLPMQSLPEDKPPHGDDHS